MHDTRHDNGHGTKRLLLAALLCALAAGASAQDKGGKKLYCWEENAMRSPPTRPGPRAPCSMRRRAPGPARSRGR